MDIRSTYAIGPHFLTLAFVRHLVQPSAFVPNAVTTAKNGGRGEDVFVFSCGEIGLCTPCTARGLTPHGGWVPVHCGQSPISLEYQI